MKQRPFKYSGLWYYSNKGNAIRRIPPGLHGLSNRFLDTPWPKTTRGKADLGALVSSGNRIDPEAVFEILSDRSTAPDHLLPDTGVELTWERALSALFIVSPDYGTRSSSIVFWERAGRVVFWERTFVPVESGAFEQTTRKFTFTIA